jgi:hypothetical protein
MPPPAPVNVGDANQQAANILADINSQRQEMEDALVRLGLSEVFLREFANNGITSLDRLRVLISEALNQLIKQIHRDNQGAGLFIRFFSQQHVHAVRFWANRMYILGLPYSIQQVTEQLAYTWNDAYKAKNEIQNLPTDIIKSPEPFKKDTKWREWKESVITYLNSKRGLGNIPLSYIIREEDTCQNHVAYATVHEQLINCAVLHGIEFDTNNGVVYDLLQSLTLNGPAWTWINAFQITRNGRGAWKSLISFYEGDSTKTRNKQECYEAIAKASYQGPKRNFDFNSYVSIHQQAHQDLVRLGEPVTDNKKV